MKTCAKCNIEKSVKEFHKSTTDKSGRQGYCKPCMCKAVSHSKTTHSDQLTYYFSPDRLVDSFYGHVYWRDWLRCEIEWHEDRDLSTEIREKNGFYALFRM